LGGFLKEGRELLLEFKMQLSKYSYPKDSEFRSRFIESKLYGGGDRVSKTRLILDSLEESYAHKEVSLEKCTIEHILPQHMTDWWRAHLGEQCEDTHEIWLHTIGNLTLTASNSEAADKSFSEKCQIYRNSSLQMNRHYFHNLTAWRQEDIELRAQILFEQAILVWPYFGAKIVEETTKDEVKPKIFRIGERQWAVKTWRDILEKTLEYIIAHEPEVFNKIANQSRRLSLEADRFRNDARKLSNSYYLDVNLSIKNMKSLYAQWLQEANISTDEVEIFYEL